MESVKDTGEINLIDFIAVLMKRKKIILAIFCISVISAAAVSLPMPKVYRARASILITLPKIQNAFVPSNNSLSAETGAFQSDYLNQKSAISVPAHKLLLETNIVLERIINRLKLADRRGRPINIFDLRRKLNITQPDAEVSILYLEAEDNDPQKAAQIANTWAQEYVIYSQELISGEVKGTGDFIVTQFEAAKQNLLRAEEEIKEAKNKYKLDLMRAESELKKSKLNEYKKKLMESEMLLKSKENSLRGLKAEIAKQEKFITVSKAITDDALWQEVAKKTAVSRLDNKKLRSEEVNPIYQSLEGRIVDGEVELNTLKPEIEYLKASIESVTKEINSLDKEINQRESELTNLLRQAEIYKRTYDNFSAKIEEARIAKSAQLGEVRVISTALAPKTAVKPNKKLNVLLAAAAGLVVGIFSAIFLEAVRKEKAIRAA